MIVWWRPPACHQPHCLVTLRTSSCSGSTTDWPPELAGRRSGSEAGMMAARPCEEGCRVAVSTSNEVCNTGRCSVQCVAA